MLSNQYYILNTYIIENKIKIKCNVILIEHLQANKPTLHYVRSTT